MINSEKSYHSSRTIAVPYSFLHCWIMNKREKSYFENYRTTDTGSSVFAGNKILMSVVDICRLFKIPIISVSVSVELQRIPKNIPVGIFEVMILMKIPIGRKMPSSEPKHTQQATSDRSVLPSVGCYLK